MLEVPNEGRDLLFTLTVDLVTGVRFFVSSRCPQTNPEECGPDDNSDPGSNKKKVNQQMDLCLQSANSVANQQCYHLAAFLTLII